MGVFNTAVITNKGASLLSKTILRECNITFTRMAVSDARLTGDLSGITEIDNIKQSEPVSYFGVKDDTTIACEVAFSNKELTTGYYVRVVGLYAEDPDEGEILYCVSTAEIADWMPPLSSGVVSYLVNVVTTVANSSNVKISVDDTAHVTQGQLQHEINNHTHSEASYAKVTDVDLTRDAVIEDPYGREPILSEKSIDGYTPDFSGDVWVNISGYADIEVTSTESIVSIIVYGKDGKEYLSDFLPVGEPYSFKGYADRILFAFTYGSCTFSKFTITSEDREGFMLPAEKKAIEQLQEDVGDFSTALDELHDYAQALITGGATE